MRIIKNYYRLSYLDTKGAFTGANKDTKGLIEEADKGYLFLDEVHRLSPEGQEKLFRYMDKGSFPEWETVDKIVN